MQSLNLPGTPGIPGILSAIGAAVLSLSAAAGDVFHNYDQLTEGFMGESFHHQGVLYHDINNVSGFYPDGEPFGPNDNGNQVIVENAGLFYNDFPGYGSGNNSLTFGSAFIGGENLTIGALASVWMTPDVNGTAVSFDLAYYEKGPWTGVLWVLEAWKDGEIVNSTSLEIAGGDDRDNPTWTTLSLEGVEFDSLHLYSWNNGAYTAARGMIDDLHIRSVPAPGALILLGAAGLFGRGRRRSNV